jgi:DNA-3-methyladenine glycosylase II
MTTARPTLDPDTFRHGLAELGRLDSAVAAAVERLGEPPLRQWPQGFSTLIDVIVGQQVSTASARAIRGKLRAAVDPLTPEAILATGDDALRACGLSRQKSAYVQDLARHVADGRLDFARLPDLPDDDAIAALVAVKGIGVWTAEIYLLFALGRPDVWPAEDLALRIAVQDLHGHPERLTGKAGRAAVAAWAPWRGIGAMLMWHYYHALTRRDVTALDETKPGAKPATKKDRKP